MRFKLIGLVALAMCSTVSAQIVIPGADGFDEAFTPTSDIQIQLGNAATGPWSATVPGEVDPGGPPLVPGNGVYDPEEWAVVFRYTQVNIPADVTVTFINHGSRAPVVWLVSGDVTIDGTVELSGATGHSYTQPRTASEPGPGGFRGGRGSRAGTAPSGGFGPGGATITGYTPPGAGSGGSYYTGGSYGIDADGAPGSTYGNARVFPLIGGSGGAGGSWDDSGGGGGAGGGALLLAATNLVVLNGEIRANGGRYGLGADYWSSAINKYSDGGSGSGGAIRIICHILEGGSGGLLEVVGGPYHHSDFGGGGGSGGAGRIRVEVNDTSGFNGGTNPADSFSTNLAGDTALIFPDTDLPRVLSTTLNGVNVSEPLSDLVFPGTDFFFPHGTVTVLVETENVEPPPLWQVQLRIVTWPGVSQVVQVPFLDSTGAIARWQVELDLNEGIQALQAVAKKVP